jgi:hypothetical protein
LYLFAKQPSIIVLPYFSSRTSFFLDNGGYELRNIATELLEQVIQGKKLKERIHDQNTGLYIGVSSKQV